MYTYALQIDGKPKACGTNLKAFKAALKTASASGQSVVGYRYRMLGTSNLFVRREIYKNGKFIVDPTV